MCKRLCPLCSNSIMCLLGHMYAPTRDQLVVRVPPQRHVMNALLSHLISHIRAHILRLLRISSGISWCDAGMITHTAQAILAKACFADFSGDVEARGSVLPSTLSMVPTMVGLSIQAVPCHSAVLLWPCDRSSCSAWDTSPFSTMARYMRGFCLPRLRC
jgi:hypothetical protein